MIAGIAATVGSLIVGQRASQQNLSLDTDCRQTVSSVMATLKSHDNALRTRNYTPGNAANRRAPAAATRREDPFHFQLNTPPLRSAFLADPFDIYQTNGAGFIPTNGNRFDVFTSLNLRNLGTWANNIYANQNANGICAAPGMLLNPRQFRDIAPDPDQLTLPDWVSGVRLRIEPIGRACGDAVPFRVGSNEAFRISVQLEGPFRKNLGGTDSPTRVTCSDSLIVRPPNDSEAAMLVPARSGTLPLRVDEYTRRTVIPAVAGNPCSNVNCDRAARPDAINDPCCWSPFAANDWVAAAPRCCSNGRSIPGETNGDCSGLTLLVETVSSEPGAIFACATSAAGNVRYCGDHSFSGSATSILGLAKDHTLPKGRRIAGMDNSKTAAAGILFDNITVAPNATQDLFVLPIDVGGNRAANSGVEFTLPLGNPVCPAARTSLYCKGHPVFDAGGLPLYNGCQPTGATGDSLEQYRCYGTDPGSCGDTNNYPMGTPYKGTCNRDCVGTGPAAPACQCPTAAILGGFCSGTKVPSTCELANLDDELCAGSFAPPPGSCDPAKAALVCNGQPFSDSCGGMNCVGTLVPPPPPAAPTCDGFKRATTCTTDTFTGMCGAVCQGALDCSPTPPNCGQWGAFSTEASCENGPESPFVCSLDAVSGCWFRPNCRFFTEHDCSWHNHTTFAHTGSQFECVRDSQGCYVQGNLCCRWNTDTQVSNDCDAAPILGIPRTAPGDPGWCWHPSTPPGAFAQPTCTVGNYQDIFTSGNGTGPGCTPSNNIVPGTNPGGSWTKCCTTYIATPNASGGFEYSCMNHANELATPTPILVEQIPGIPMTGAPQYCGNGVVTVTTTTTTTTSTGPNTQCSCPTNQIATTPCDEAVINTCGAQCGKGTLGCSGGCIADPATVRCGDPIMNAERRYCGQNGRLNCPPTDPAPRSCRCPDPNTQACNAVYQDGCGNNCPERGKLGCAPPPRGSRCTGTNYCSGPGDSCGGVAWQHQVRDCPAYPGEIIWECMYNAATDCFGCAVVGRCPDNRTYDPYLDGRY
jgi:hypothetical protein